MLDVQQLSIIGTGLLGGSLGLALRRSGFHGRIIGIGHRQSTLDIAREKGCIDQGTTDLAMGVAGSELIIIATPVRLIAPLLAQLSDCAATRAVITDVGSTKLSIFQASLDSLRYPERFVGSHPMAGKEVHGPQHACAELFAGKPCIITPAPPMPGGWQTDTQAVQLVEQLWSGIDMRVVQMSPEEHDQAVARISHLPHLLAVLMVQSAQRDGGLDVASTGFRDTTRIAGGDPQVWADIFLSNPQGVSSAITQLTRDLQQFQGLLEKQDRDGVLQLLEQSKQLREKWMARQWGAGE